MYMKPVNGYFQKRRHGHYSGKMKSTAKALASPSSTANNMKDSPTTSANFSASGDPALAIILIPMVILIGCCLVNWSNEATLQRQTDHLQLQMDLLQRRVDQTALQCRIDQLQHQVAQAALLRQIEQLREDTNHRHHVNLLNRLIYRQ